jgi:ketosteroid isomerase-like protein
MARTSSAAYVTAVLNFLQAFNRDDLDACEAFLDQNIEWHSAVSYKARDGVRGMLECYRERFTQARIRPDDFREAGGHVLMIVCFYEGDPDAAPREQRQSWIVDVSEDGLVRRVLSYLSPAEAARAFDALSAGGPKVPA